MINEELRETISHELYQRRKAEVGDVTAHMGLGDDTEDEDLIGYDSIEPGLPPASSDRQKWWLDNKQPARAAVPVPRDGNGHPMALNPHRSSNPFGQSDEPDWISIPRSSSKASLSSISSSPFEKVTLPHGMASGLSGMPPRKLPPPFDPSTLPAKVGRMNLSDDHGPASRGPASRGTTPPPPPPPRRQTGMVTTPAVAPSLGLNRTQTQPLHVPPSRPISVASHNSHASHTTRGGKSPPPVAKKPAHLATISPSASPVPNRGCLDDDDDFRPPLPSRAATSWLTGTPSYGQKLTPTRKPVGPGKAGTNGSGAVGATHMQQQMQQQQRHARQKSSVDLLGSLDEGHDMGGWETLKPSTRT